MLCLIDAATVRVLTLDELLLGYFFFYCQLGLLLLLCVWRWSNSSWSPSLWSSLFELVFACLSSDETNYRTLWLANHSWITSSSWSWGFPALVPIIDLWVFFQWRNCSVFLNIYTDKCLRASSAFWFPGAWVYMDLSVCCNPFLTCWSYLTRSKA